MREGDHSTPSLPDRTLPVTPLSYSSQPAPRQIRRRGFVVACILAACLGASWVAGARARDHVQNYLYVRQAADRVEPAEQVMFEPDRERAADLLESEDYEPMAVTGVTVAEAPAVRVEAGHVATFDEALGEAAESPDRQGALLFLHELTSASGARRIVAIRFLPWVLPEDAKWRPDMPAGLVAHVFDPGHLLARPQLVGTSRSPILIDASTSELLPAVFDPYAAVVEADLRWFAGQPDDLDDSHFTLAFELGGQLGTVDGFLSADGSAVHMNVRPAS